MRHIAVGFAFLLLFCISVTAQDRIAIERGDKDRDVYKGLVVGKKFTGRLPNGYKDVVSNSQREEIYKIQQDYFETVELLKARIELLESEKNLKIDGLLSGEQRTKLKTILSNLESEKNVRRGERVPVTPNRRAPTRTPVATPATEADN